MHLSFTLSKFALFYTEVNVSKYVTFIISMSSSWWFNKDQFHLLNSLMMMIIIISVDNVCCDRCENKWHRIQNGAQDVYIFAITTDHIHTTHNTHTKTNCPVELWKTIRKKKQFKKKEKSISFSPPIIKVHHKFINIFSHC